MYLLIIHCLCQSALVDEEKNQKHRQTVVRHPDERELNDKRPRLYRHFWNNGGKGLRHVREQRRERAKRRRDAPCALAFYSSGWVCLLQLAAMGMAAAAIEFIFCCMFFLAVLPPPAASPFWAPWASCLAVLPPPPAAASPPWAPWLAALPACPAPAVFWASCASWLAALPRPAAPVFWASWASWLQALPRSAAGALWAPWPTWLATFPPRAAATLLTSWTTRFTLLYLLLGLACFAVSDSSGYFKNCLRPQTLWLWANQGPSLYLQKVARGRFFCQNSSRRCESSGTCSCRRPVPLFLRIPQRPTRVVAAVLSAPSRDVLAALGAHHGGAYLSFGGKVLEGHRSLSSYGIVRESSLDLCVRWRGGGRTRQNGRNGGDVGSSGGAESADDSTGKQPPPKRRATNTCKGLGVKNPCSGCKANQMCEHKHHYKADRSWRPPAAAPAAPAAEAAAAVPIRATAGSGCK